MSSTLSHCMAACSPAVRCSTLLTHLRSLSCQTKDIASFSEDLFGAVGGAAGIAKEIYCKIAPDSNSSVDTGTQEPAYPLVLDSIEQACVRSAGLGKLLGTGSHIVQMFTGAAFFSTTEKGEFVYHVQTRNNETQVVKARKSAFTISSNVTRLASNVLRSTTVLGDFGVVKLGRHANNLSLAGSVLGLASSALSAADDVTSIHEQSSANVRERALEANASSPSRFARCKMLFFSLLCNLVDFLGEALFIVFVTIPQVLGAHATLILGVFGFLSSIGNFVLDVAGMI